MKLLQWDTAIYGNIKQAVHERAKASRVIRPTLPIFGDQTLDPTSIPLYTFDPKSLKIQSSEKLASVRISRNFDIDSYGYHNEGVGAFSAERATEVLSAAEDALLIHGKDASARLKSLGVLIEGSSDFDKSTLRQQKGLFDPDPSTITKGNSLYDTIVLGMTKLQDIYPNSTYCVVVSSELWGEAVKLLDSTGTTLRSIIEELLRPSGSSWGTGGESSDHRLFRSSRALDGRTGIIFVCRQDAAMGNFGGVIDVAVPSEAALAWVGQNGNITLSVEANVALRLNDPKAVISFQVAEASTSKG
jgi:hypothetical protein